MNTKTAFKYALIMFFLMCLSLLVSKLLNLPLPIEVVNDQDAVVNGVWRTMAVGLSLILSFLTFIVLISISLFKKK